MWSQNGAFLFKKTKMASKDCIDFRYFRKCRHFENISFELGVVGYSQLPIFILIWFWEIKKFLMNGLRESACIIFLFDTVRIWEFSPVWTNFDKSHNLSRRNVNLILKILSDLETLRGSSNKKTLYSTRLCVNWVFFCHSLNNSTYIKEQVL
jgi:hypothetical protein